MAWRANALWFIARARSEAGVSAPPNLLAEIAIALVEAAQNAQAMPNDARYYALNNVARTLVALGLAQIMVQAMSEASSTLDQAMRVARSMKDSASRNDSLGAIAVAYATGGQFSNALQIARSIDGPRQRAAALLSIAQTMPN